MSGVPVSGLVALLRGSDEQMKKESVFPPAMSLVRHAEPSVLENTSLPRRSVSLNWYSPARGATMRISKADAPMPFPKLVSEPSLGTGLKNTSRAPSAPTSTPTVGSSAGADSARAITFHGVWQTYFKR